VFEDSFENIDLLVAKETMSKSLMKLILQNDMNQLLSLKFRPQMATRIQHRQTVMRSPMDQNYHKSISKGSKTIQPVTKLKCAMPTQGARTHARNRNIGKTHMRPMRDYGRKNPCTCENGTFMRVVGLPPTSGSAFKLI
jgi:hypothetical protein